MGIFSDSGGFSLCPNCCIFAVMNRGRWPEVSPPHETSKTRTMKILSNNDIKEIEKYTIDNDGVTSVQLVERAARAIADEVAGYCSDSTPLMVFAGWGKNGADALETARLLASRGYAPEVYLFNIGGNRLCPECKLMRDRLAACEASHTLHEVTGETPFTFPEPPADTIIIDGIFGSGLNRPMPRPFQLLAQNLNCSGAFIISIDLPSGLLDGFNGDTPRNDMVHAGLTLALGAPRLSFFIEDNAVAVGQWKLLDIGLNSTAVRNAPLSYWMVQGKDVRRYLRPRDPWSNKSNYGDALIAGGSHGMGGAAVLAARGCLRSGAGKVTVYGPQSLYNTVQCAVLSAMMRADSGREHLTDIPHESHYSAFGIGPGLDVNDDTAEAVGRFLKTMSAAPRPVVVDAGALGCIAARPAMLEYLPMMSILTPHIGEFDRIFGKQFSHEARLKKAIEIAKYYQIIIVLKGRYTAIIRPDEKVFFNTSGTPAMATPGSGDVLTGIMTGFLAQGFKPEMAAFLACYIHGIAGEIAAENHGEYGVTAEDIAANVGRAIALVANAE